MHKITITLDDLEFSAALNDSPTAQQIWDALPITAVGNTWGDEVYFEIPVKAAQAPEAQAEVAVGTLAYWPPGSAFCIFFGPTPVSRGQQPRAYSPVNEVGYLTDDAEIFVKQLRAVRDGATIRIAKAE